MRYFLISLGCAKNTVDAEGMGQLLDNAHHQPVDSPEKADLLIVGSDSKITLSERIVGGMAERILR